MDNDTKEMAEYLVRWKDRILASAATKVENHFFNRPVEDFTAEDTAFEKGLRVAVDEICSLMADPSYFNRTPTKKPIYKLTSASSASSLSPTAPTDSA